MTLLVWGCIFVVVAVLGLLFPPTGDDWRRLAFADRSFGGYLAQAIGSYVGHNGRIVGNSLSFVLIDPLWLRAAVKALTVTGLVVAVQVAARAMAPWAALGAFAGIFLLPAGVFRESYVWSAGFFNYVPPLVVVLLLVSVLGSPPGEDSRRGMVSGLVPFVLSFAACLFVEHVTVALLALAVVTVVVRAIAGRPSAVSLGWVLGAILGSVVMFASPGLRDVAAQRDAYFSYSSSLGDLIERGMTNYAVITGSFVFSNPVLLVLVLTALLGGLSRRAGRRGAVLDRVVAGGVLVVAAHALLSRLVWPAALSCPAGPPSCNGPALAGDLAMMVVLLGVVVVVGTRLPDARDRRIWWALLAATVLMLGPLLVVSPIGPRNLFGATATLTAMAVLSGRAALEQVDRPRPLRLVTTALGLLVVLGVGAMLVVNGANGRTAMERARIMEAAVAAGQTRVELPPFPYPSWVHDANDAKMGNRYYLENPRDIEIVFP